MVGVLSERCASRGSDALEYAGRLYTEAFPEVERIPLEDLVSAAEEPCVEFVVYYDGRCPIGFSCCVELSSCVYVPYLAIGAQRRSKGYGSQILARIKKEAGGKAVVLEIEPPDANANNNDQRVARMRFYERNGFTPTGFDSWDNGMRYLVMIAGDGFDAEAFTREVASVAGGVFGECLRPSLQ